MVGQVGIRHSDRPGLATAKQAVIYTLTPIHHGKRGLGPPGHCGRDMFPEERKPDAGMDSAHTQQSAHSCPGKTKSDMGPIRNNQPIPAPSSVLPFLLYTHM